jgi:hypothetical protein
MSLKHRQQKAFYVDRWELRVQLEVLIDVIQGAGFLCKGPDSKYLDLECRAGVCGMCLSSLEPFLKMQNALIAICRQN